MVEKKRWLFVDIPPLLKSQIISRCAVEEESIEDPTALVLRKKQRKSQYFIITKALSSDDDHSRNIITLISNPLLSGVLFLLTDADNLLLWENKILESPVSVTFYVYQYGAVDIVDKVVKAYQRQDKLKQVCEMVRSISKDVLSLDSRPKANSASYGFELLVDHLPILMAALDKKTEYLVYSNKNFRKKFKDNACLNWGDILEKICFVDALVERPCKDVSGSYLVKLSEDQVNQIYELNIKVNISSDIFFIYLSDVSDVFWHKRQLRSLENKEKIKKKIEQQQKKIDSMMEWSRLGEVMVGVSHQINQPLAVLSSNLQLAHDNIERYNTERLGVLLDGSLKQCQDISSIIESIRNNVNSLQAELKVLNHDELNNRIKKKYQSKDVDILLNFSSVNNLYLDVVSLEQVIIILTDNSIEQGRRKSVAKIKIQINFNIKSECLEMTHRDNCKGVEVGYEEEIFKSFFSTKETGMGVGLSLAERLVQGLGGKIEYVKEGNKFGALFKVTLPLLS